MLQVVPGCGHSGSPSTMLKFMKHQHKLTPERIQKQKELFGFHKACYHGFPSKPSAMAWDPRLRLLAIATRAPAIRLYGQPGVEVYGQSEACESPITHLIFLTGQCRLVSLSEDNSLHLWEMREVKEEEEGGGETCLKLVHMKSTSLEGKLKKISVLACEAGGEHVMVGTEGGNIYLLQVASFTMAENIIYQDVVMQNVPEDYKLNPGPVEAIAVHPKEAGRILIGYQRGLVVLWDTKNLCADQTYISSQQLESVCWHTDPAAFTTSHNDGSYMVWSALDSAQPADGPQTVYGPFPCKPITKILRPSAKDGGQFTIFSGGMPRASYGDRHTVTAIEGDARHTTFSLSSRVLDFAVVLDDETGVADCLVILAEEEIVFIDLVTEDWPSHGAPYLASLHSSAITCSYLCASVANDVLDKIKDAGIKQQARLSPRPWPISGGVLEKGKGKGQQDTKQRDILLTGHEDGTVQFWEAGSVSLRLLYKLSTAQLFVSEDLGGEGAAAEDDDWPPFRKAGLFDPYSDDPRLGVKKMQMCPYTGTLVVAGTAGQVLVMAPATEPKDLLPQCIDINLVAENDSFVWKSHSKLEMRGETVKLEPGMQPTAILQFFPPASCTSLALHSEWNLVACGTAHGFALFDAAQNKSLLAKSTLSPLDLANTADEGPMSRRKSLKKSLRESFRRLRRGRSQRKTAAGGGRGGATSPTATSPPPSSRGGGGGEEEGVRPVERAIEARTNTPDHVGSMVRCLHITKCFIANSQAMSATLWAGTNSGSIFVFTIAIPPSDKRKEVPLTVQLGKEIHLKHGAPVLGVWVLDGSGLPLPVPMAVKKDAAPPPSTSLPHRVLICSEEQFKVFTLPQLKPFCKFKLTAHEGSRARKLDLAKFVSTADPSYSETCLALATNQGDFSVFSLPDCRRQLYAPHLKKEDISGINSVVFTQQGEALYLASPSELERISLSARHVTRPRGEVPEMRSAPPLAPPKKKEEIKQGGGGGGSGGGGGGGEGGETSTATTTTTTTAPTAAPTAASASVPEDSATVPLKNEEAQNGEKEKEAEGKEGKKEGGATGGGGEVAAEGGGGGRKVEEVRENGDNSVLSGDITIDSIRDHIEELKVSEKGGVVEVMCAEESNNTTTTSISSTSTTTTISKSTTITASSSTSQESQSIQVVETALTSSSSSSSCPPPSSSSTTIATATSATTAAIASTDANHSVINGTE